AAEAVEVDTRIGAAIERDEVEAGRIRQRGERLVLRRFDGHAGRGERGCNGHGEQAGGHGKRACHMKNAPGTKRAEGMKSGPRGPPTSGGYRPGPSGPCLPSTR